ncbi:Endonuclease/exonuclease/phosphatase superfamily [Arabidopsis suecica]|uniref:Endonuclease/exonuclease/phosphatase superfamily n=1 Tax=Arabidopsis suecica TaxID=45249 RepID=A0A8T2AGF3_ARASU|nr:Endonuclease/exonuclease/phosphatase superfamily [Arabidopsis suecica]
MPLWVDFKGVPGNFYSQVGLRLDMARVLVEVDLEKALTEKIYLTDQEGNEVSISVSCRLASMDPINHEVNTDIVTSGIASATSLPGVVASLIADLEKLPVSSEVVDVTGVGSVLPASSEELQTKGAQGIFPLDSARDDLSQADAEAWSTILANVPEDGEIVETEENQTEEDQTEEIDGVNGERNQANLGTKKLANKNNGKQKDCNPWVVVGDFNVILSASEHSRSLEYLQDQAAMRVFQDVILDCGLEDLSYVGPKLTWSISQDDHPICKKLESAMVNSCWLRSFPNTSAFFEMGGVSDHARFWVQLRAPPPRNRRPFQFFNHLASHTQFLGIINEVWSETQPLFHSRMDLNLFHKKLKLLKELLRRLNREKYGNLPSKVKEAYDDLSCKQNAAHLNPQASTFAEVTESSERWNHLATIEEQFYHQKSRVRWMQFGDHNTDFFHRVAEGMAAKNAIKCLKSSSGEVLTEVSDIKNEAVHYYKNFLQDQTRDIDIPLVNSVSQLVSYRCSAEEAGRLVQPIQVEEIQRTLFSMPLNKAPGPDGYTVEFFKAAWPVVGHDFVVAVQSFFLYGFMPKGINGTILTLVPKAAREKCIGVHPKCKALNMSHLSFADDIMVFTDGSLQSLHGVLAVFDEFARMSGLNINVSKSSLFAAGRGKQHLENEAVNVGLAVCELPVRYLGLPLTTKAMTKLDYEPLLEKIQKRLSHWTNRHLSFAGRVQLIKSVIASITNFWSSVFCLPKRCFKEIEGMCSSFLWSGSPNNHSKSKVAWEDLCVPKNEGGLGIRRLHKVSRVFALGLIWKIISDSNSLWVALVRQYLIRQGTFWDVKETTLGSWQWRKLLKLRPLAVDFVSHEVRNGHHTFFWFDKWLPMGRLIDQVGEAGICSLGVQRYAKVADAIKDSAWCLRRCRDSRLNEIKQYICGLNIPSSEAGKDVALWRQTADVF